MTGLAGEHKRVEFRGYIEPGDPLWSLCTQTCPRKTTVKVLELAREALQMEDRFEKFKDGDHPLGDRLSAMTAGEAFLYLLLWSKDCGRSSSAEPGVQTPAKSTTPTVAGPLRVTPSMLDSVNFDPNEMDALSALPCQLN